MKIHKNYIKDVYFGWKFTKMKRWYKRYILVENRKCDIIYLYFGRKFISSWRCRLVPIEFHNLPPSPSSSGYYLSSLPSPPLLLLPLILPAAAKVLCKTQPCRAFRATSGKYSLLQSGGKLNWRVNFELQRTNLIFLLSEHKEHFPGCTCKLHNCVAGREKETWYIL